MVKIPKNIITPKQMESRAKFAAERAYQLERFSKFRNWKEIREWKAKATVGYRELANYYENKIGGKKKAEMYRQKADEYSTSTPFERQGNLEKLVGKTSPVLSILFFAAALVLVVFNLTGYAIGNAQEELRLIGLAFFLAGLVFAFLYLRKRNN